MSKHSHPKLIAWSLAGLLSLATLPAFAGQGEAPKTPVDVKAQMETIKGALAASKLVTSDPITVSDSIFRTELASYTADQITFKDIHSLQLGGEEVDGSYTNLYTFKVRDMVLNVPWRGFMNGMTVTLSCAAGAECVRNEAGQTFPTVTLYVSNEMGARLQKSLRQVLEAGGAQAPSTKATAAAPAAAPGGMDMEHH